MDITQLKSFVAVAEYHSFTKAAENMYKSQSVLSRHIQSLESELGFPLFIRDSQTCELTPAGKYYYDAIKNIANDYQIAETVARKKSVGLDGNLTIGMSSGENNSHLSELTYYVSSLMPDININFCGIEVREIPQLLKFNTCDIVMTVSSKPWFDYIKESYFKYIDVGLRHDCLYMSRKHKTEYDQKANLSLRDFADETFLFLAPFELNGKTGPTMTLLKNLGMEPNYRELNSIDSLIIALQNDQGVHIGSNRMWCFNNSDFITLKLPELGSHHEIMMWNGTNTNPCVKSFIDAAKNYLSDNPGFADKDYLE